MFYKKCNHPNRSCCGIRYSLTSLKKDVAEEPLMAGGSCLLGSLNLSEFVKNAFTAHASVDWEALENATFHAVVALNDVLDEGMERLPLEEQRKCVSEWRQIGLGTMGLHDMLLKLGMRYGSDAAIKLVDAVYHDIAVNAIVQSLQIAKEKGAFNKCKPELIATSSFITSLKLPSNVLSDISTYGLRNSQILTCAPTGSIGTMLQTSTGVEPHFALKYTRKTQSLSGKDEFYDVDAAIVQQYKQVKNDDTLPAWFVSSADIDPIDRIRMQEALQRNIDASISSTINLPNDVTEEDVRQIYMEAWKHNLKGVTIYRSGCKREGILTTSKEKKNSPQSSSQLQRDGVMKRSKELLADFYTVKIKGEQFIVLVGMMDGRPYEIFAFKPNIGLVVPDHQGIITKKSKMHYMYKSEFLQINELELANESLEERAATLYASMLLRHNVPINQIIKIAKKVNGNIASFSSAMCRILSKYIPNDEKTGAKCPDCGADLVYEEGCIHCPSCGYSRCGN